MKVTIKDKTAKSIVGEMVGLDDGMGVIAEMISDPAKLSSFGFDQTVISRASGLRDALEDDKPEYPVVRVEEGWSGSKRLWNARELDSIVAQTNSLEPVGNLGHIKDEDASTAFGDPQTTWIGALAKTEPSQQKDRLGEQVRVAYFAGYNHPGAKVRGLIRAKAVRGISWWGNAEQVPVPGKGVEVRGFTLKALDWARKLSEGMPTSRIVAVTSEMEDKMDKELSQVTPDEFERENPNAYTLIFERGKAESAKTIGEMETAVAAGDTAKDILAEVRKSLKMDEKASDGDILTVLAAAMAKIGVKAKALLKDALDRALLERIPGDDDAAKNQRALVARLLPVGEMEDKLSDAKEDEDTDKIVGEMLDTAFNTDDTIKQIVGEQQPVSVRRREQLHGGASDLDKAVESYGGERQRVTLGS
jgi:hypothetical protein